MWAADRVVAPNPGSAITILEIINKFAIKALFDRILGEIRAFSQHENESLTDAWLRMKELLRNCHGHNLSKGNIIKIFYNGLKEITQEVLNAAIGDIFLYKTPNQSYQLLEDKVLLKLDWAKNQKTKSSLKKTIAFSVEGSGNSDTNKIMTRMDAMTMKMDAQYKEFQPRSKPNTDHNDDDIPMSHEEEAKFMQTFRLNNDVRNDLEDFKRRIRSMRTVHDKLFTRDDLKTAGVLPNKKSKTINQEPQTKTDLEKSITKFLDGQRVTNMFFKNNVNDMILKMKQNEKNFQTKIKNMERKIDEWEKSQNVFSKQIDRTEPQPPPQAYTENVNAVFTGSGKSDDPPKTQKDPPPSIIVNNKIKKDRPIKTSKKGYHVSYVSIPSLRMCTYGLCRLFWNIGIGIKLYEWAGNLVAPELVLDHHLLDRSEHSLLVLRSPKYPKSKKNMLDEEEVLCQP
ncbi:reverse transcriptase domain-containing protein [Tanacetum coccineum]